MNSNKEQELRDKVELVVGYYLSGQFNADTPEGVGYIALEDACTNSVIALIEEEIRKARIDELHLFEQCSDEPVSGMDTKGYLKKRYAELRKEEV